MQVGEYQRLREVLTQQQHRIAEWNPHSRADTLHAAKRLGMLRGPDIIEFDGEEELDVLMDYAIYERNKKGVKLVNVFHNSNAELSKDEKELLQGQANNFSSLFEVVSTDKRSFTLQLKDVLHKDQPEYTMMDIGFSQTAPAGLFVFTRLIPIRDVHVSSGQMFGYRPEAGPLLAREFLSRIRSKIRKMNSSDLYVLAFERHKRLGVLVGKV